jgi:WD40 repeat protein
MILGLALLSVPQTPSTYVESFQAGCAALDASHLVEATADFEACLSLRPKSATVAFYLACASARSKENEKALEWLSRSVGWGYDDAKVAAFEPDLAELRNLGRFGALLDGMRENFKNRPASSPPIEVDWLIDGMYPEISPDGQRVLLGRSGRGYLIDIQSQDVLATLSRYGERVSAARFSRDGRFIVTAMRGQPPAHEGYHEYLVWDASTGAFLHPLEGPGYWEGRISFSANGDRVLCSGMTEEDDAGVWDVATGKLIRKLAAHQSAFAELSPDGHRAVIIEESTSGTTSASMWDADTGTRLSHIEDLGRPMFEGGFSEDGTLCCVHGYDARPVLLLDARTGEKITHPSAPMGPVYHTLFLGPGSQLVTASRTGGIRWWDLSTGQITRTVDEPEGWLDVFEASRDGRFILLSGSEGRTKMLDASTGQQLWTLHDSDDDWLQGGSFSVDGDTVATQSDWHRVDFRRSKTGDILTAFGCPSLQLEDSVVSPNDGSVALACSDGTLRVLDPSSGRALRVIDTHSAKIRSVAWSAETSLLAVSCDDATVRLYEPATGELRASISITRPARRWWTLGLSFSPDGKSLLGWTRDSPAFLWNVASKSAVRLGDAAEDAVAVAWTRDGQEFATATSSGVVRTRDARSLQIVGPTIALSKDVEALAFDPAHDRIVVGAADAKAHVFEISTGKELSIYSHEDQDWGGGLVVAGITFSADGKQILTTTHDFGEVRAWNTENGTLQWRFDFGGGNPPALNARYSSDGRRIYTSGQSSRTVRVTSATDGQALADLQSHGIEDLQATPGDRWLIGFQGHSMEVMDGKTFRTLYTRVEFDNAGFLIQSPSLHCDGTPAAMGRVQILRDGTSCALDSYAALLYDPKKVRASVAGIDVVPALLPSPPRILIEKPSGRIARVEGESTTIEARAEDPSGILGFEVERDGQRIQVPSSVESTDSTKGRLSLVVPNPEHGRRLEVRIRAVANSGALSKSAHLTLVAAD